MEFSGLLSDNHEIECNARDHQESLSSLFME